MNQQFDDITLSSYVDGELDPETMRDVETVVETDANARKYVVNAVKTTARLRAFTNEAVHEEVPEHLVSAIRSQPEIKERQKFAVQPLFRMAAAILLILVGFGAGSIIQRDGNEQVPLLSTPLIAQYGHVVDQALEYNLSGTPREWQAPQGPVIVMVTPVKTYRDKDGLYYREYRLEASTQQERQQINGLAYRTANGKWKTKAVFYQ
jgi:surface antigen